MLSGLPLTNRFLAKEDNATAALGVIRRVAGPGAHVVFVEAACGNIDDKGLLATVGPWAVAIEWQLVLLVLVVVVTLGQRFGLPIREPMVQRGTRELVDAVSNVIRRGNKSPYALQWMLDEGFERLREMLRAPRTKARGDLLKDAPPALAEAFREAARITHGKPHPQEAAAAARRLFAELDAFEREQRKRR